MVYTSLFLLIFMAGQFSLFVSVKLLHQCAHPVDPLGFLEEIFRFSVHG